MNEMSKMSHTNEWTNTKWEMNEWMNEWTDAPQQLEQINLSDLSKKIPIFSSVHWEHMVGVPISTGMVSELIVCLVFGVWRGGVVKNIFELDWDELSLPRGLLSSARSSASLSSSSFEESIWCASFTCSAFKPRNPNWITALTFFPFDFPSSEYKSGRLPSIRFGDGVKLKSNWSG